MCGIAGLVGIEDSKSKIEKMLFTQSHRGPDNMGIYIDDKVAFGHNRLSIIDLSEEANQPFTDISNRYFIIFNGEIYNYLELKKELDYPFKTSSDTEVLLAAFMEWGKDCLNKLNGMFSFAIWDKEGKSLFVARDRFGVKPFYYHVNDHQFYFASEIKTLFRAGLERLPSKEVWANYFSFGSYGMPNQTFWHRINQLPAGHWLEFTQSKLKIERWYSFEQRVKINLNIDKEEAKNEYYSLLEDSIKLRFRSDVPVGINLSGGLDSSTLLTFVNKTKPQERIEAFTFYTNDPYYDELPWVEEMIDKNQNRLNKVLLDSGKSKDLIPFISHIQDEPFGGIPTIAYSQIFKAAREEGIIVLQDGQGMDEQWAGYDYYANPIQSNIQGITKSPFRKNVLSDELRQLSNKPEYPKYFNDNVLNTQYRDLFYTKIPRALRFNDRVSMAYSTELREPFLDYRLVEFAFSLPLEYKINKQMHKYLLRELVSEHVPKDVTYAPKRPLQTPQREWLANELKEVVEESIVGIESSEYASWFNIEEMKKEWEKYQNGDQDSSFHLWQWINFYYLLVK